MRRLPILVLVALGLSGCGYFNSLYNANRHFSEAQRAEATGDLAVARPAYRETIEKAAASYRGHPEGRWSDDALVLIGRSRFALGEPAAAAAAMRHVLDRQPGEQHRLTATAYLGAALVRLDSAEAARPHLDAAIAGLRPGSDIAAFARLWRARAAFAGAGQSALAWEDLTAAAAHRATATQASLEALERAVAAQDSAALHDAFAWFGRLRDVTRSLDTLDAIFARGAAWSPAVMLAASTPLEAGPWRADVVDRVAMARARIAAEAGQKDMALRLVMRVTDSGGWTGSRARLLAARWQLAALSEVRALDELHALLLPAYDNVEALALLRHVRATQLLAARGAQPASSLSLFAAAELARDALGAPLLARQLFLDFAAITPEPAWAGKAVLAAHDVAADEVTADRLAAMADNPYVLAAAGHTAGDAFEHAEQRLARGLAGMRADAIAEVTTRDVSLGRAVVVLDSTRAAARTDSARIACGAFIDSIGVRGIRADSTRVACIRGDSARIAFVLQADTALLLTGQPAGTRPAAGQPARPQVRPDTLEY